MMERIESAGKQAKINPFANVLSILKDERCDRLHSFAVTALKESRVLQKPDPAVMPQIRYTFFILLSHAARKVYENGALRNLRTYLGVDGRFRNANMTFALSPMEANLLLRYLDRIQDDGMRKELQKQLFNNHAMTKDNLARNKDGQVVIEPKQLSDKTVNFLNSVFEKVMIVNQMTIRSIFKLTDEISLKNPEIREAVSAGTIQYIIQNYPVGPILDAFIKYLNEYKPTPKQVNQLIQLFDHPSVGHLRLQLAEALKPVIERTPSVRSLYEKKLEQYGINPNHFEYYDVTNLSALRRRLDEVIVGQEEAKNALMKQLEKKMANPKSASPLLYLDGKVGIGKTALAEKLAVELNSSLTEFQKALKILLSSMFSSGVCPEMTL